MTKTEKVTLSKPLHPSRFNSLGSASSTSSSESISYGPSTPTRASQVVDDEKLFGLVQDSPQNEEIKNQRRSLIIQNFNNQHSSFCQSGENSPTSPRTPRSSFQQNKIVKAISSFYKNSKSSTTLSSPVTPGIASAALFFRSLSPTNATETVHQLARNRSIARLRHSFPLAASTSEPSLRQAASGKAITMSRPSEDGRNSESLLTPTKTRSSDHPPQPPSQLISATLGTQRSAKAKKLQPDSQSSPVVHSSIPRPTPIKRKTKVSDLFSRLSASSTASSRAKNELKSYASAQQLESIITKIPSSKMRSNFFKSRHSTGNLTSSISKPIPLSPNLKNQAAGSLAKEATHAHTTTPSFSNVDPEPTQRNSVESHTTSLPSAPVPSQMDTKNMRTNRSPPGQNSLSSLSSISNGASKQTRSHTSTFKPAAANQPIFVTTTPSIPAYSSSQKFRANRTASNPVTSTVTATSLRSQQTTSASAHAHPNLSSHPTPTATADLTSGSSSPSHIRRQSDNYSITISRPSSRLRSHRRPASRNSVAVVSSRSQNVYKVEELKSKIYELEEVLLQEKAERETVYMRINRINSLETALERERSEKAQLLARLKAFESGISPSNGPSAQLTLAELRNNRDSTQSNLSNISASKDSSGDEGLSDHATVVGSPNLNDWQKMIRNSEFKTDALESKISALELEIENRDIQLANRSVDNFGSQIMECQNTITELKLGKEALRNENDTLHGDLRKHKETIKNMRLRSQNLERKITGKATKLNVCESQIALIQEKLNRATEEIEARNKQIKQKTRELEETRSKLKSAESHLSESETQLVTVTRQLELVQEEVVQAHNVCEKLQAKAQHERWQGERQVTALERDNRRGKRIIAALETSLQDLKISLEEKAMENDELNRSIQKVMEQANETIEGAKRHSLYIASPAMSPLSASFPISRPASASNATSFRYSANSQRNSSGYLSSINQIPASVARRSYS